MQFCSYPFVDIWALCSAVTMDDNYDQYPCDLLVHRTYALFTAISEGPIYPSALPHLNCSSDFHLVIHRHLFSFLVKYVGSFVSLEGRSNECSSGTERHGRFY
jgi:hypothetical protein